MSQAVKPDEEMTTSRSTVPSGYDSPFASGRQTQPRGHRPKHAAHDANRTETSSRCQPDQCITLADELRSAAWDLFHHVDELHYAHGWPLDYVEYEQRAYAAIQHARTQLTRNKAMTLQAMLAVLAPATNEWWPERSPLIAGARTAVDRIRRVAARAAYDSHPQHGQAA